MSPPRGPEIVERAPQHSAREALRTSDGSFTYGELLDASGRVAASLLDGRADLDGARICFRVAPGFAHIAVQWGIWRAGGIAVPLALSHPPPELEYVVRDAAAGLVIADGDGEGTCRTVAAAAAARLVRAEELLAGARSAPLPTLEPGRPAMMVYTSGTTGRPKGVVSTHANIAAQISALVEAWAWTPDDRILLVLPLHHVHGIINVVGCALWSGACCEILPGFDADAAWEAIASGRLTLFMAVPTIYRRLIAAYDTAPSARQATLRAGCARIRLMVSGSAALPIQTLQRWREITGHTLLERYGMTEMGMALSNPLHGERRPGSVGTPLPGVEVRLVTDAGAPVDDGTPGELEVRGANVFREYWRRPDETRAAFRDGWFRTGDTAVFERGSYRLLGRSSVDILKTGGYKVSALEIEELLREHPAITECAVVGVEDPEWGDRVCVAVELRPGATLALDTLKLWAKDRLAPYKVPRDLRTVAALPRNAMGKVVKPDVAKLFGA
ncbi:MAG: acyl-CoA synthetase [Gemmatimonadaceae bacterium]